MLLVLYLFSGNSLHIFPWFSLCESLCPYAVSFGSRCGNHVLVEPYPDWFGSNRFRPIGIRFVEFYRNCFSPVSLEYSKLINFIIVRFAGKGLWTRR